MEEQHKKKGITRRESLQWGAGLLAGLALPFPGFASATQPATTPQAPSAGAPFARNIRNTKLSADWVKDLVVIAMPAAAVGGKNAGVYTGAENGIKPWGAAIIRWLTSKNVRGNGGVLVRQEGPAGGAGVSAIIDPNADYEFNVMVHVPGGNYFGTGQEEGMQVWVAALDAADKVLAEAKVEIVRGDWARGSLKFSSGSTREVRCVVFAKSATKFPCLYYVDQFNLQREDYKWWNPQNYFNATRTVTRLQDRRQLLQEALTPDALAGHNGVYLNWDHFFSDKGIPVGGGNWEQEYNHISIDDPQLKTFEDNGIARDIDGKKIGTSLLWPGYQMCHNAPAYRSHFIKSVTRIAPEVSLFTQDNINMPSFQGWGKGCFCKWCLAEFTTWLQNNRSQDIVKQTGIRDYAAFNFSTYLNQVRPEIQKNGEAYVLANPVLKAFLLFHYVTQTKLWGDAVSKIKQAANRPIAVMGNQYGNNGEKPFSVALSRLSDVVCTESNIGTDAAFAPFDRIKAMLLVKLGFASGAYQKPVWLQYSALFHSPVAAKSRLRFISAQSLANNGIPFTWATTIGQSGWFFETEAEICRFTQLHRHLFSRCQPEARVGLVYSLPTQLWRRYTAFGLQNDMYQKSFYAFAHALEEMHVPYEVNCWWHPLLGDDEVAFERLSRYQVLVLPGVDCFTVKQLQMLRRFRQRGGQIIHLALPALYNENAVAMKGGSVPANHTIEPELLQQPEEFRSTLKRQVFSALGNKKQLETDAPAAVWAALNLDESRKVLSLHLVNGSINEKDDQFNPVTGSNWRILLPDGFEADRASLVRMEAPAAGQQLPFTMVNGRLQVTVPLIEGYTIVSFYAGNGLAEVKAAARQRRTNVMQALSNDSPTANTTTS